MKIYRILYFVIVVSIATIACFFIGFWASLFGLLGGLIMFATPFAIKFSDKEKKPVQKNDRDTMYILYAYMGFVFLALIYFNYAMVFLSRHGVEKAAIITSVESKLEASGSGNNMVLITYYYCHVNNYVGRIECTKTQKKGDSVYYLFSPELTHTLPILYTTQKPRGQILIEHGGMVFLMSIIFVLSLLLVWFFNLYRKGYLLLQLKISLETEKEIKKEVDAGKAENDSRAKKRTILKLIYLLSYLISFAVFALFILALLKNLYLNITFKFWSIGFTTLALIVILVTDWGERLFELSNNIIFGLRHYIVLSYLKQIIKVILYLSFGKILFESIIHPDKSFADVLLEFLSKYFDINVKGLRDFFTHF